MNKDIALGLSIANLTIWGSWSLVRMNCNADGPIFLVLFLSGQWITGFICSIAYNNYLFSKTLSAETISEAYSPVKVFMICMGGFLAANGDFLCSCACTRIPVAIAFPVYAGFCLVLGIILTYIVENGHGSKAEYLFPGLLCAVIAILVLALVEANSSEAIAKQQNQLSRNSNDRNRNISDHRNSASPMVFVERRNDSWNSEFVVYDVKDGEASDRKVYDDVLYDSLSLSKVEEKVIENHIEQRNDIIEIIDVERMGIDRIGSPPVMLKDQLRSLSKSSRQVVERINIWVYICLFGGVIAALWSPLSNLGRNPPKQVTNPSAILFLFESGSFVAMPFMLLYYGIIIIVRETNCRPVYPTKYICDAYKLPLSDKLWGMLSGGLVALGYTCYFISSSSISPTVALGIASCEPLATIVFGSIFARSLRNTSSYQRVLMLLSVGFFTMAIVLMALSGE